MYLLLEIDPEFYGSFMTTYKKGENTNCKIPERHICNHGGEPNLLQEVCKDPGQDWIPTEFV